MGRGRKSTADGIMEITAMMPRWFGVVLAIASYFVPRANA